MSVDIYLQILPRSAVADGLTKKTMQPQMVLFCSSNDSSVFQIGHIL